MITLSEREHLVAEQYCKGLADKEVADSLQRSEWTIKAQKRDIYKKLGISKDTELVLYMFCERMKINFDIKEIRKHGLEIFFSILFLVIAALDFHPDMRQCSRAKTRTTQVSRTRRTKQIQIMNYTVNNQLRTSILFDGTAEARLADILAIMTPIHSVKEKRPK